MFRSPGYANSLEYSYQGPGDFVMEDGDTMTLTQDYYIENLTMNGDASIDLNGYKLKVLNKLAMHDDSTIFNNGQDGSDGDDGGLGGGQAFGITVGYGHNGGDGARASGDSEAQPGEGDGLTSLCENFSSGRGGFGTTHTPGLGFDSLFDRTSYPDYVNSHFAQMACYVAPLSAGLLVVPSGGAGGGGGGSDDDEHGGGGGGGGGVVHISAGRIVMTDNAFIVAIGGNGGSGSSGGGFSGGGGGGQGGAIILHAFEIFMSDTARLECTGGFGGIGAGGGGNGVDGDPGPIWILSEKGVQAFVEQVDASGYPVLPSF